MRPCTMSASISVCPILVDNDLPFGVTVVNNVELALSEGVP